MLLISCETGKRKRKKESLEQSPQWTPELHGVNAHVRDAFERV
jgi:hypothetical protein